MGNRETLLPILYHPPGRPAIATTGFGIIRRILPAWRRTPGVSNRVLLDAGYEIQYLPVPVLYNRSRSMLLEWDDRGGRRGRFVTERLYDDIAGWWPVISPPAEYAEEAALYVDMFRNPALRPVREVLELGSGGGNNASHMKWTFAMTLVEPSDRMRENSRRLNPECEHLPGDMRHVRLGRTFDAVFLHDAVMYMTTEDDLRAALETVAVHLSPGGVALVAPDATTETFSEATDHGGGEDEEGRQARYLEWTLPPEPGESTYTVHYAFLLRGVDGNVNAVHDVHREGLFPRATWLRLFREVGLDAELALRTLEGQEYDSFVAVRAAT
jgi:SAM-dependent methyltransferase